MDIQFGLTDSTFNTQYAPLGVLLALYKQKQVLNAIAESGNWGKNYPFFANRQAGTGLD